MSNSTSPIAMPVIEIEGSDAYLAFMQKALQVKMLICEQQTSSMSLFAKSGGP
jgi:hypothetical protein